MPFCWPALPSPGFHWTLPRGLIRDRVGGYGRPPRRGPLVALPAVLAWGLASNWLSPCHLAGVPLVVGWLAATPVDAGAAGTPPPTGVMRCRRTFIVLAFALGILLSLPPSVQESLPERHLARHVVEVVEGLDLIALERDHGGWGSAANHPAMLLALLIYGYVTGCYSRRKIERATYDSLAFRYIAGNGHPDHDNLAAFRRRFSQEFEEVLVSVLQVARENQLPQPAPRAVLWPRRDHRSANEDGGPATADLGRDGRRCQRPRRDERPGGTATARRPSGRHGRRQGLDRGAGGGALCPRAGR